MQASRSYIATAAARFSALACSVLLSCLTVACGGAGVDAARGAPPPPPPTAGFNILANCL